MEKYQKMIDEYVQNELVDMKTDNNIQKQDVLVDKNLSSQNNPENGSVEIN